ncbi:tumor necrosis factor receptor superfamily member 12A [Mantella aurantiaca]
MLEFVKESSTWLLLSVPPKEQESHQKCHQKCHRATAKMESWNLLKSLLLLLLVGISRQEATDPPCEKGFRWSRDLERCKDCKLCEISSKDDFCQTCDSEDKQADFPLQLVIIIVSVSAVSLSGIITLTLSLIYCRRKNKFTTPIEETGAHSAEELLIH